MKIFVLIALILTGFLTYSNSLNHGFMLDDHAFFDERTENIKFLPSQFLPDRNKALGVEGGHGDVYYRPLALVLPMLCRLAFGTVSWPYHLVNLLLFCAAAFMIYFFARTVFEDEILAFLTAFLYLVHPINGLVVNFVTAIVFPSQVIFMLAALYFSMSARKGIWVYAFGFAFYILALMCHETSMILPLYLLALLWAKEGRFIRSLLKVLPFFIFTFIYFLFRLHIASLNNTILHNFHNSSFSAFEYLSSFSKLIFWYLGQLFYPQSIVMIWATPIQAAGGWSWIFGLLGLIGLWGFLCWRYRADKIILLGLLWLAIGFIPVTMACAFQPMNGLMIEPHWLIFSSIGFFLCLGRLIILASQRFSWRVGLSYVLILGTVWIGICRGYNELWGNEQRYCLYWLSQAPCFRPVKFFLARTYLDQGNYKEARRYYKEIISHMYVDHLMYGNLGYIALKQGHLDEAEQYYLQALKIEPYLQSALSNLGIIACEKNGLKKAEYYFRRAMKSNPYAASSRLNMAHLYVMEGKANEAILMYESVLNIVPKEPIALFSLMSLYQQHNDHQNAIRMALKIIPTTNDARTLAEAGLVLAKAGMNEEALSVFEKVVRMDPTLKNAYIVLDHLNSVLHR